jgi:YegS/Rv2252/BmrU family lipid kinase
LDIAERIRSAAGSVDIVVVAGGDGTLNAAAPGLTASALPLGILPLGTANDLARTLGIPLDPAKAAKVIAAARTAEIDLGTVNGRPFFNVAQLGLGAEATRRADKALKRRWSVLGYGFSAIGIYRSSRPFRAAIRSPDGSQRVHAIQISVGNGRSYGGGLTISDDAAIDDQQLDLYSFAPRSLWQLLVLLPALKLGKQRLVGEVTTMRAPAFEIETSRPLVVTTDGEVTTRTLARFEVLPRAISVFTPEAPGPGVERNDDAAR